MRPGSPPVWIRLVPAVVVSAVLLGAWILVSRSHVDWPGFAAGLLPYRHAWYSLPIVVVAFVALGLALVPVVLLIALTGVAFGPILGPVYALAGSLASASAGFAIGRWLGAKRVQALTGERMPRLVRNLKRNGVLAVFLIRKVPAPFTLVNIVVGASTIRYRDFLAGTTLGMAAVIVALAGFGHQLTELWRHPSLSTLSIAALVVAVPLTIAWAINRALKRTRPMA